MKRYYRFRLFGISRKKSLNFTFCVLRLWTSEEFGWLLSIPGARPATQLPMVDEHLASQPIGSSCLQGCSGPFIKDRFKSFLKNSTMGFPSSIVSWWRWFMTFDVPWPLLLPRMLLLPTGLVLQTLPRPERHCSQLYCSCGRSPSNISQVYLLCIPRVCTFGGIFRVASLVSTQLKC